MARWEVCLQKLGKYSVVGTHPTRKQAQDEVKYRYDLCNYMGVRDNFKYKTRKVV
jgi:hypothetical protein